MSVIVKGMKMPDSCAVCRFAGKGGYHMERVVCMFTGKNEDAKNVDRLSDCPLVALPDKHGRLVDADALIEQMEADAEHMDEPYAKMMYHAAISDVKHAPTIEPERKTGKWIDAVLPNDNGGLPVQVCDQCNTFFPLAYTGGGHHYCPNCGARMEGGVNGF